VGELQSSLRLMGIMYTADDVRTILSALGAREGGATQVRGGCHGDGRRARSCAAPL
jgi:hypothetical protein